MDESTVKELVNLNNSFYRDNCESFSRTRKGGWDGWRRVCDAIEAQQVISRQTPCRILDVASGNLRFERYVREMLPGLPAEFTCLDSCAELHEPMEHAALHEMDVIERLTADCPLLDGMQADFDVAVSFGFMHHIPTRSLRERFLHELFGAVRFGGLVAVSFWQFAQDESLAKRARATTKEALEKLDVSLEEGDYLIGWDAQPGVYRYCHSFSAAEIDSLVGSLGWQAAYVERFEADGRNGALNGYALIHRR